MKSVSYTLLKHDWRQLRTSSGFKVILILSIILGLAQALLFKGLLHPFSPLSERLDAALLRSLLGMATYGLSFLIPLTLVWGFGGTLLTQDKASGTLEVLLAGPLRPTHILISKSLLLVLPSAVISLVCTLPAVLILLRAGYTLFQQSMLTLSIFLNAYLLLPLLFLGLTLIMTAISFIKNGDIAILPSFIIGFAMMILIPAGVQAKIIDISSWTFTIINISITGSLLIISSIFLFSMNKEKIILNKDQE